MFYLRKTRRVILTKLKESDIQRRQDLPKVWEINGAIYIYDLVQLKKASPLTFHRTIKFVMDDISSVDIDSNFDWMFAEFVLNNKFV